ncbi:MAG TPA: IS1380 family transposase [Pseudonocardiaceae bacterium]|nr:IS1380 family transposase [Pseudonocardiaceae bacterium]
MAVAFDDEHAVDRAGLMLVASLAQHIDLEGLADETIDLGDRPGAFAPGRKLMTLVHSMAAGGDFISDIDLLRAGATADVLGHRAMAATTVGTFLRSFSFGHVRQLDRVCDVALSRAWSAGAGPGDGPLTIDIDSTVVEVHGYAKQGAAYGHTRQRGYHPLLATRADTGEVLHLRFRKGSANTARGARRFIEETIARVRRAGATGPIVLRADSGFHSASTIDACRAKGVRFSITARMTTTIRAAIDQIPELGWVPLADYPDGGFAELAETTLDDGTRLIVRRTIVLDPAETLFKVWRYHAFVTDREGTPADLDVDHRRHAQVELVIRDLKAGPLAHCPSGRFNANAAWAAAAVLAHNLQRWTAIIGGIDTRPVTAKTIRRRYLDLPGRITTSARKPTLHLPARWPAANRWMAALATIRTVALC